MDKERVLDRRHYVPTAKDREMVKLATGHGLTQAEIATILRLDSKTLRKYFREELDSGSAVAVNAMAQNLWKKAMGDGPASVTATIFWLKVRAGWREASVSSEGDKTLTIKVVGGLPDGGVSDVSVSGDDS